MGILVRFCACGAVRSTQDVREGRPCAACRQKKHLKIPPLEKIIRKANPAPDLWAAQQAQKVEVKENEPID